MIQMSFLAFNLSSIFGFVTNLDKMSVEELLEANAKKNIEKYGSDVGNEELVQFA